MPHHTSSERHRLRFAPTTVVGGVESSQSPFDLLAMVVEAPWSHTLLQLGSRYHCSLSMHADEPTPPFTVASQLELPDHHINFTGTHAMAWPKFCPP